MTGLTHKEFVRKHFESIYFDCMTTKLDEESHYNILCWYVNLLYYRRFKILHPSRVKIP